MLDTVRQLVDGVKHLLDARDEAYFLAAAAVRFFFLAGSFTRVLPNDPA